MLLRQLGFHAFSHRAALCSRNIIATPTTSRQGGHLYSACAGKMQVKSDKRQKLEAKASSAEGKAVSQQPALDMLDFINYSWTPYHAGTCVGSGGGPTRPA